jgi:hypothetical protein
VEADFKAEPIIRLKSRFDKIMLGLAVAASLSACCAGVFWVVTGMTPDSAEWFWVSTGIAGASFPSDAFTDEGENTPYTQTDHQAFFNSARTATALSAVLIILGLMIPMYRW